MAEAEELVKADLLPDEAAANVTMLKQMLAQEAGRMRGGARSCRWPLPGMPRLIIGE